MLTFYLTKNGLDGVVDIFQWKTITKKISKDLEIKKNLYFDVTLIKDKRMIFLNNEYRNINKTTDVLSFVFNGKHKLDLLGEIFINIDEVKRKNNPNELNLLFIHGILHLLGYDHDNIVAKKKMFSLQEKILNYVSAS